MRIQSIHKVKGVKKHGEAIYRDLLCASLEESSNKDEQCACLKTMWKLWHTIVPPGVTLEPHAHKHHEQIYFIIEGTGIVSVGEEKQRVNSGDAFDGAFTVGFLEGWELEESAEFANAVGALTTLGKGAVGPLPRRNQVYEFIKSHRRKPRR